MSTLRDGAAIKCSPDNRYYCYKCNQAEAFIESKTFTRYLNCKSTHIQIHHTTDTILASYKCMHISALKLWALNVSHSTLANRIDQFLQSHTPSPCYPSWQWECNCCSSLPHCYWTCRPLTSHRCTWSQSHTVQEECTLNKVEPATGFPVQKVYSQLQDRPELAVNDVQVEAIPELGVSQYMRLYRTGTSQTWARGFPVHEVVQDWYKPDLS